MDEFSKGRMVEKAWRLLRETQYLSDLDWDVEFPESSERETVQKTSAFEKKKEKPITPDEGCSSHSLQPEIAHHLVQKEASNSDETDTTRHSSSVMESRVSTHQANFVMKEETDCIEIKEEPMSPYSSDVSCEERVKSETLYEDIMEPTVYEIRKESPETSFADCSSHSLQPDIVESLIQSRTYTSDETDTRRCFASVMESRVFINQTNNVVKEEPDCIEVKEEPLSPLASNISFEEPVKIETLDGDIQVSNVPPMKKKLETTSFVSFHCDASGELSPGTESGSVITETHWPIMTQMDSSKKGNGGTYVQCSTACSLQIASSSSQPLLTEAVGMSTEEHSSVLLQNSRCQTSSAMGSCSTAIGRYLSERGVEEKVAEQRLARRRAGRRRERERTCDSRRRSERDVSTEISLPEREMEKAPSLKSSCEESVRESNGKAFECSTCKKHFPSKILLAKHLQRHTGEKCYMCSHCEESFSQRGHLITHMSIHLGRKPYKCSQCGKSFSQRGHLIIHMRIHSGEKPYKCRHCEKSFTQRGHLITHMPIHSGEKPFKCSHCEKSFTQRGHLITHMPIHSGVKPYMCSQCEKSFSQRPYLIKHMRIHSGEKPYQCSQCEKAFSSRGYLIIHMRIHSGEKPYECSQCKKSFSHRATLIQHMRIHSGEKPYQCSQCEKSFSQRAHLNQHMRIHTGDKPYECSQCKKSFSNRGDLTKHMRIHSGKKPFKCSQCEKSFRQRGLLNRHIPIHSGEKPYQCSHCEKSFSQRGTLIIHMRIHSGEKPYKCSQCEKSFSRGDYLIVHMRIHTGEKPFMCSQCDKSFRHRGNLSVHMGIHK